MNGRVIVTQPLLSGTTRRLGASGLNVEQLSDDGPPSKELLCERVRGADALVCLLSDAVDADVLDAGAPTLRVVSNVAVGVDNVDLEHAAALGVAVCNTPGVLDAATADLAMALLLACCRRLVDAVDTLRRGGWSGFALDASLGRDLEGMRLGLVGYGRIGQRMASRAAAFEMRVSHHARRDTGAPGYVTDLDQLLSTSDAISLHLPLTDATRGLIDAQRLVLLPRGAVVVNTARGPILDEASLIDALVEGQVGAAGLDVFDDEPNVSERLRRAPNVVLTPHIGSATRETRAAMCELAVDAVLDVLGGRRPRHLVTGATDEATG